jgi:hypothetical protein
MIITDSPRNRVGLPGWFWIVIAGGAVFAAIGVFALVRDSSSAPPPTARVPGEPGRVLVVGDSVAFLTGEGLQAAGKKHNLAVANGGTPGCGFVRGGQTLEAGDWVSGDVLCDSWPGRWNGLIGRRNPEVVVMLAGYWDAFDRQLANGQVLEFGSDEADEYVKSELNAALDVLTSSGAKVLLLTTPYFAPAEDGEANSARNPERVDHLNALYRDVAAERGEQVEVLDLNEHLTPDGFTDSVDGVSVRGDGVHLTRAGEQYVAEWLGPRVVEAISDLRGVEPEVP